MSPRTGPRKTRADERIDEIDVSPTALLGQVEALRGELETTTKERDEYVDALKRERAEFTNFRRRTEEERSREAGLAGEGLLRKVLALADDFDLALARRPDALAADPWVEGIAAIDRKLRTLLDSEGLTPIEAEPGSAFDPRLHEAIRNEPTAEHPEGAIVYEIRRGYSLRDRVIRPALVAVATPGEPTAATNDRS